MEEIKTEEEIVKIDPDQFEKDMLQRQATQSDPMEYAAMIHKLYVPVFRERVDKLSARARARVLKSIVELNLSDKEYKHTSEEFDTVLMGQTLCEAKFVLSMNAMSGGLEQLEQAANSKIELTSEDIEKLGLTNVMTCGKIDTANENNKTEELNG